MSKGNLYVRDGYREDAEGVFLHTASDGDELPETLFLALEKRARWDDAEYLARVLFDSLTREEPDDSTAGYGISAFVPGSDWHPFVVVEAGEEPHVGLLNLDDAEDWTLEECYAVFSFDDIAEGETVYDEFCERYAKGA